MVLRSRLGPHTQHRLADPLVLGHTAANLTVTPVMVAQFEQIWGRAAAAIPPAVANCSAKNCTALLPAGRCPGPACNKTVINCMVGGCPGCGWDRERQRCERASPPELPPAKAAELWAELTAAPAGLAERLLVRPLGGRSCAEPDRCVGVAVHGGVCVCY